MSYVLVIFDYLWFSWRMIVFAVLLLLEKMSLMVIQSFFVFVILLELKLLKFFVVAVAAVAFLHVLKFLYIYSFVFCNFASLYLSERFIQFVAQFPLYWHSFLWLFSWKDWCYFWSFFAYREQGANASRVDGNISIIFQMESQVVKSCFEVIRWKSFDHTFHSTFRKQFSFCL